MERMGRLAAYCVAGIAAVLAVSCGKEETEGRDGSSKVEFTASELQVKTVFGEKADGAYPVLWTANEKVALFYNSQTGDQTGGGQYIDVAPSSDGHTAAFSASFTDDGSGSHSFYAMSPLSALNWMGNEDWDRDGVNEKILYANIPHDQTPVPGTCDEKAQIVFAKAEFTEFPDKAALTFSHMTAYGLITSLSLPEEATEIVGVLIESDKIISGELYCNYNIPGEIYHSTYMGEYDKNGKEIKEPKAFTYISLDVNNGGLKAKKLENVFFACTPQTGEDDVFREGNYLKLTVWTTSDTWVKTIKFSADRTLAFKAGHISSFSVSAQGFEKQ